LKKEGIIENLNEKCKFLMEESKKMELSLEQSKNNGEKLHRESEMVISNVNTWVHEQRNNSEKLISKIKEQATAIVHLNTEHEKSAEKIELYQQKIKKLKQDCESSLIDKEKIKVSFFFSISKRFLLKNLNL
jgi:uncharacterized protein HemX